jgi:hypothetical protein
VNPFNAFQMLNGHRFVLDPAMNNGVGGDTSSQMATRFDADVAANYANFDWLFCGPIGTNDGPASINKETTLANSQAMATKALLAGKGVVLQTIYPRTGFTSGTGTQKTTYLYSYMWVNAELKRWARTLQRIVPLVITDPWVDLSDPANVAVDLSSGYTTYTAAFQDGLHPTDLGGYVVGRRLLADFPAAWLPPMLHRSMGYVSPFDATRNPQGNILAISALLTTTGGTATNVTAASGVPASWTASQGLVGAGTLNAAGVVYSMLTAQAPGYDAVLGNRAQLAVNIASGKGSVSTATLKSANVTNSSFWTPGRKVYGVARVKLSGLQGFAGAGLSVLYSPSGGVNYERVDGAYARIGVGAR